MRGHQCEKLVPFFMRRILRMFPSGEREKESGFV